MPFAKSGYEFFVCPGVNNWSRILPDFGVAVTNIQNFVRDGVKHGALGMLNTDWEDDGEAINAVKWHADAWAAECAWNASTTSIERLQPPRRRGALRRDRRPFRPGRRTAGAHASPARHEGHDERALLGKGLRAPRPARPRSSAAASNLLAVVRPALQHLEACRREARCNQHVLDAFLFGARRMELIGQRMLDGLEAAQLYETELTKRRTGRERA